MFRSLRLLSRRFGLAFLVIAAVTAMPLSAMALTCPKDGDPCAASIATSIWTGTPTVFCNPPYHVVHVVITVDCPDCQFVKTVNKCGSSSGAISFFACGHTHTVTLKDTHNWEETLTDCEIMTYTVL